MDEEKSEYDRKWWTTEAMIRRGGGFVRRLGELWRKGDMMNQAKLESTFTAYFEEYEEQGRELELERYPTRRNGLQKKAQPPKYEARGLETIGG